MIKSSFTEKDEQASEVLILIHTDVCRPMNTSARGGYHYHYFYRRPIEVWARLLNDA